MAFLGITTAASAAPTITVTMTNDTVDFGGLQQIPDLPGPDGQVSFREACIAASNTIGPETIAFAIPQSPVNEWSGGVAILFMDYSAFVLTDDETIVDFTTQTAFTGDTNPTGAEVGVRCAPLSSSPAIFVSGNRCVIKGFGRVSYAGHGIQLAGNDNRVIGCTISGALYSGVYINNGFDGPPASGNIVGGTAPGEGNVLSAGNHGVRIDTPAANNIVIGNTLSGTYAGIAVRGNPYTGSPFGNRIGGPTPEERNIIAGAGRYGEEGFPDGAQIELVRAVDTLIEGNYIGTTPDGLAPAPSQRGPAGVEVADCTGTIIRNNVIGGIRVVGVNHYSGQLFGAGIAVVSVNTSTIDTVIENNIIGADPTGENAVPNLYGISAWPFTSRNLPYGTLIRNNRIAFNERAGVRVQSLVTEVTMTGNSIAENGLLGIDLLDNTATPGVTPNDTGDGDSGANGLQNFPVLTSATTSGTSTLVEGTLNSSANTAFNLEFFANDGCDPSGHGEGEFPLGGTVVTTNASGDAAFSVVIPSGTAVGQFVTALATHAVSGNTSEFSMCQPVAAIEPVVGDIDGDGDVDMDDSAMFVNVLLGVDTEAGHVTAADVNADGTADAKDTQDFVGLLMGA